MWNFIRIEYRIEYPQNVLIQIEYQAEYEYSVASNSIRIQNGVEKSRREARFESPGRFRNRVFVNQCVMSKCPRGQSLFRRQSVYMTINYFHVVVLVVKTSIRNYLAETRRSCFECT